MKQLITLLFLLIFTKSFSQNFCATEVQHQYLLTHSPEYKRLFENRKDFSQSSRQPNDINATPDTIPVVVHVINLGGAIGSLDNPTDADIQTMINRLNNSFNVVSSIDIFFTLAQRDPICQPTTGIVRVDASGNNTYVNDGVSAEGSAGITQQTLAAFSFWDNTKYLNIWLVNKIGNGTYEGYGYYPTGGSTTSDGALIQYPFVTTGPHIAHEVGHCFNLLHTFQGSNGTTCPANGNCNVDGDQICDTDPVLLNTNGCLSTNINPCTGTQFGSIVFNLMSYNNSCSVIFTTDQKNRMRTALTVYRASLLTSEGEFPPPCTILPIRLLSFDAKNTQCNKVLLQWQTTQEQNNKGFSIEQSTDGIHFTELAFVKSNGNTNNMSKYHFTTDNLNDNKYYFRLKQIDYDGRFDYSTIVNASINCGKTMYSIYPNPVHSTLTLSTNASTKNDISICNMYGQTIKTWHNTANKTLDVSSLASGTYVLLINEKTKLKFVKL